MVKKVRDCDSQIVNFLTETNISSLVQVLPVHYTLQVVSPKYTKYVVR